MTLQTCERNGVHPIREAYKEMQQSVSTRRYALIAPSAKHTDTCEGLLEKHLLSFTRNTALTQRLTEQTENVDLFLTMSTTSEDFDVLYTQREKSKKNFIFLNWFNARTPMCLVAQGKPSEFLHMEQYLQENAFNILEARAVNYAVASFCLDVKDTTEQLQTYLHELSKERGVGMRSASTSRWKGEIRGVLTGSIKPVCSLVHFLYQNGWEMQVNDMQMQFEYREEKP